MVGDVYAAVSPTFSWYKLVHRSCRLSPMDRPKFLCGQHLTVKRTALRVTMQEAVRATGDWRVLVHSHWRDIVWGQFGAAIDSLERAMVACPERVWSDRSLNPEFWYVTFHTLFWLDYYLSDSIEGFAPPAPFTLDELDPAGIIPERPYTKAELQSYLDHCRAKCRKMMEGLTEEKAREHRKWSIEGTVAELYLYNMRHVQHHTAQLNLILRQQIDSAPSWVSRTPIKLGG